MIGVIVGLKSEAAALGDLGSHVAVRVAAASPARAEALARDLVGLGARLLVSSGLAGALDPDLKPGDLVSAQALATADGATYRTETAGLADVPGLRLFPRSYGSDVAVASVAAKRMLAEQFCAFVDMESHGVARAAMALGVPWMVLRAVADDAGTALPDWAIASVTPDGGIDTRVATRALLRNPLALPAALRLARANSSALRTLRQRIAPVLLKRALG